MKIDLSTSQKVGAVIGIAAGITIAYKTKRGFLGYLGLIVLGSVAGQIIGSRFGSGIKASASQNDAPVAPVVDKRLELLYANLSAYAKRVKIAAPQYDIMLAKWSSLNEQEKLAFIDFVDGLTKLSPPEHRFYMKQIGELESSMIKKYGEATAKKIMQ